MSLEQLLNLMPPDITPGDRRLIERAYEFGENAHCDQKRKSGEPYFLHCEAVAMILAEMKLDTATIAAGLLHDVVEDTSITLPQLEAEFGLEVARLVDGVTKMDKNSEGLSKEAREAKYLQKTITSMSNDVRVILIKLADRLHNMKTVGSLKTERQRELAQETMDLFVPLANRLGMWKLKAELEDLCFRYIEPEAYKYISHRLQFFETESELFLKHIMEKLQSQLHKHNIQATISGRPKNIYSIYKKMQRKNITFEETFDVRGIRVIVEDKLTCYTVLGIVHSIWRPVRGEFDDYIASPKDNFYQSLHTAVYSDEGKTFEVQIRTAEMHQHAEYGIAAHWLYKEKHGYNEMLERRINYLRNLIEPAQVENDAEEFVRSVIEDIDDDRIYVFTPDGDIIDLPRGATPIDFAYHIHTEVGHRCRGAKVNTKLVTLDYHLKSGERVEIITSARGGPSLEWLEDNLRYVRTNRARTKIRDWFRKQGRSSLIQAGKQAMDAQLHQMGIDDYAYEELRQVTPYGTIDDMFVAIGEGDESAMKIVIRKLEKAPANGTTPVPAANTERRTPILGVRGYDVKLARCCDPQPGDDIIGYITRQATVTVHRTDCPNIRSRQGNITDRLISVKWGRRVEENVFKTPVEIVAHDRTGLMAEIGYIAAQENINMTDVRISSQDGIATFRLMMEIEDYATLSRVLTRISALDNVVDVHRLAGVSG
ncbi:MAG: bifunctional (p)ppGpp synthetase/guanosine-3',5'-bis(diphosphate) 3'-pyrophosphohydrolase [Anaerolineae bacterium]|nr:bifunctional (p)ppGpp synthetase/guanosine-3',5'-bis(diphosphate) 3'-pyrophosphohydrolase [Anaerolineae bacterium]